MKKEDWKIALEFVKEGYRLMRLAIPTPIESARNKYIRMTKIHRPCGKEVYGFLIEFGVKKTPSEGIAIGVNFGYPGFQRVVQWTGQPFQTHEPYLPVTDKWDRTQDNGFWCTKNKNLRIHPKQSFYLFFETKKELSTPEVMYFAVYTNESIASENKEKIGKQYTIVD